MSVLKKTTTVANIDMDLLEKAKIKASKNSFGFVANYEIINMALAKYAK